MSNLLKEAIADAKAVRETALQNAKAALEEAFTPRLQSMLSQKLKEDEAEENEDEVSEEEVPEEDEEAEEMAMDELEAEEEEGSEDHGDEEEKSLDVDAGDSVEEPVSDLGDDSDDDSDDDDDDDDDLDVEAIVKELEAEEDEEAEEGYDVDETETEEDEEVAETIELNGKTYRVVSENDETSGIGDTDEEGAEVEDNDDPAKPLPEGEEAEEDEETVEEIVDLSELLDELEGETEEDEDVAKEVVKLQGDLTEHRKVIKYLKSKLNEVNLLNAKLLFTNKLFKTYNLNNNQKLRVVETFDRAKNSREIKLIYSTLAESFSGKTSGVRVTKINESFASKPVKSTKPKKVIAEGSDLANRFKKLAGIN